MPIIVATHPRANVEKLRSRLPTIDVRINETPQLIKQAKFVLSYDSTAISYAVLANKPVLFYWIRWQGFPASHNNVNKKNTITYSKVLKTSMIDEGQIDDIQYLTASISALKCCKPAYLEFRNRFLVHPKSDSHGSLWSDIDQAINVYSESRVPEVS